MEIAHLTCAGKISADFRKEVFARSELGLAKNSLLANSDDFTFIHKRSPVLRAKPYFVRHHHHGHPFVRQPSDHYVQYLR
ncbi:hypothetical protein KCP78_01985 [Salmonella enterica subsp. enterica]|nr:hypothetical protein KCP78_01985 [Salmonella enterica subsp. enterica]